MLWWIVLTVSYIPDKPRYSYIFSPLGREKGSWNQNLLRNSYIFEASYTERLRLPGVSQEEGVWPAVWLTVTTVSSNSHHLKNFIQVCNTLQLVFGNEAIKTLRIFDYQTMQNTQRRAAWRLGVEGARGGLTQCWLVGDDTRTQESCRAALDIFGHPLSYVLVVLLLHDSGTKLT